MVQSEDSARQEFQLVVFRCKELYVYKVQSQQNEQAAQHDLPKQRYCVSAISKHAADSLRFLLRAHLDTERWAIHSVGEEKCFARRLRAVGPLKSSEKTRSL